MKKAAAFLIIAHDQPHLLDRLVKTLHPHPVFIHLSPACNQEEFRKIANSNQNAQLLPEDHSHATAWGGFNLVRAQISLGEFATKHMQPEDYLVWLSGRDFPIKPIDKLIDFLDLSQQSAFIGFFQINTMTPHYGKFIKNKYYYDQIAQISQKLKLPIFITRILNRINGRFPHSKVNLANIDNLAIANGYPRFALQNSAFQELELNVHGDRGNVFKQSHASDDMFFHTAILNSNFRNSAKPGLIPLGDLNPKESIRQTIPEIWCDKYYGQIIDEKALDHLTNCDSFFARKFDEVDSNAVLKYFEKQT